jgi:hypothetical protein
MEIEALQVILIIFILEFYMTRVTWIVQKQPSMTHKRTDHGALGSFFVGLEKILEYKNLSAQACLNR